MLSHEQQQARDWLEQKRLVKCKAGAMITETACLKRLAAHKRKYTNGVDNPMFHLCEGCPRYEGAPGAEFKPSVSHFFSPPKKKTKEIACDEE